MPGHIRGVLNVISTCTDLNIALTLAIVPPLIVSGLIGLIKL